jgi:SOS response regulatory protein OraA/RecX
MDGVTAMTGINDVAQVIRSVAGSHWQDHNRSNEAWIAVGVL